MKKTSRVKRCSTAVIIRGEEGQQRESLYSYSLPIWIDPAVGKSVNKIWAIHTREHSSAMKRNQLLTPATIEMTLDGILLRDRSPVSKGAMPEASLYVAFSKRQNLE